MSEPEQEAQAPAEVPAGVDPVTGEVLEPDDVDAEELSPDEELTPDDEDAELEDSANREAELAAERQADEQSLEAQQREQDAKNKKLVQQATHLAKRYSEILGPDLDGFVACPLCGPWFPGIRLPVMPDYETVAAVKVAIGEDPDPPLIQDRHSIECSDCNGLGKVLTGSKVAAQKSAQCLSCGGTGWQPTDSKRQPGTITASNIPYEVATIATPPTNGDEPPEAKALRELGFIVVPPVNTPESIAAQGG